MNIWGIGVATAAAAFPLLSHAAANAQVNIEGQPKVYFIYFNVKDDRGWAPAQEEARVRVMAVREEIVSGTRHVSQGPISDKDGNLSFVGATRPLHDRYI